MKYSLSNRQAKELRNGKVLSIAIPWPDAGIPGMHRHHDGTGPIHIPALEAWYRSVLDTHEIPYTMQSIALVEMPVDPLMRSADSLSSIFGAPYNAGTSAQMVIRILSVLAEITTRPQPRSKYPGQWPGRLSVGGIALP